MTEMYKPYRYSGKGKFKYSVLVKAPTKKGKKVIHFGHKDYQDFTQHKDEKRRKSYLARARGIRDKNGKLTHKDKNSKNYWAIKHLWNG